jgi:hypothetical protein
MSLIDKINEVKMLEERSPYVKNEMNENFKESDWKEYIVPRIEELNEEICNLEQTPQEFKICNRGTGAGGANTNLYGKKFEEKTNNYSRLLENGFTEIKIKSASTKNNFLLKTMSDGTRIIFVTQSSLKMYIKQTYNIEIFRHPDEAYIIETPCGKRIIKILEKKEQNGEGSVETKLWSGPSLKREYELALGNDFEVHYGYCLSNFLKQKIISANKKYTILYTILQESQIQIMFGDDADYFENLDKWIYDSTY